MADKDQIKFVNIEPAWRRALLVVPVLLALYGTWSVVRWCLGNMLASNPSEIEMVLAAARTRPNDPKVRAALEEVGSVLHAAERFAPDDPQVQYTLGAFARRSFEPEELREALARYERATSLSPYDFRLWSDLGRARGQTGDTEAGERALRFALELAPRYAMPRWHLGNLLLRAGREREAFEELRRAANIDSRLHPQVFSAAWSYFGGDLRAVADAVGDSSEARARLVEYLVSQKRAEDALVVWETMRPEDKRSQAAAGKNLLNALIASARMRKALEVYRDSTGGGQQVAVGQIMDGGFESEIGGANAGPFDWIIKSVGQAGVGLDAKNPHGGARSLRISFSAPNDFTLGQFKQVVLVEPQTSYRLTHFFRTEELKGAATVFVEVVSSNQRLAAAAAVPAGTNDWREAAIEFTTPAAAEAVEVRVVREPCAEAPCPLFGKLWYDDFNLQRVGGSNARAAQGR